MIQTTRLAPSPTGALHLGNARTFLATWAIARQRGWQIVMRIEDLDGPRVKRGADQQALDDLRWMGIDWDGDVVRQSQRIERHRTAIAQLIESGAAYACVCTRSEIEQAASAPHAEDGSVVYPGTCRGRFTTMEDAIQQTGRPAALRFAMPDMRFEFRDSFAGVKEFDLAAELGDFVLAKPDGTPAYQLAVVVDDADAGVTDVIRGDDLIDSVPRQVLLYQALRIEDKIPAYTHLPLVIGEDGRRLAKRHGDTRIATYRAAGVARDRLLALLARWLGIPAVDTISPTEIVDRFDLARAQRAPIVFTADDDRWLRGR